MRCKHNNILSTDCPPTVSFTPSPPYTAGQQLTCSYSPTAGNDNPAYEWHGTIGGEAHSSTSPTVSLQEGEFCLVCIVTVDVDVGDDDAAYDYPSTCSSSTSLCDSAGCKYRKQHSIAHAPDQTLPAPGMGVGATTSFLKDIQCGPKSKPACFCNNFVYC